MSLASTSWSAWGFAVDDAFLTPAECLAYAQQIAAYLGNRNVARHRTPRRRASLPTDSDALAEQTDRWAQRKLALVFGDPRLSAAIVRLTDEWSGLVAKRIA